MQDFIGKELEETSWRTANNYSHIRYQRISRPWFTRTIVYPPSRVAREDDKVVDSPSLSRIHRWIVQLSLQDLCKLIRGSFECLL